MQNRRIVYGESNREVDKRGVVQARIDDAGVRRDMVAVPWRRQNGRFDI